MKHYPLVKLRFFEPADHVLLEKWFFQPENAPFLRHFNYFPTKQDLINYPQWSQNVVFMAMNEIGETIGMTTVYGWDSRAQSCKVGGILDSAYRKTGAGHAIAAKTIDFLIKSYGIRKVIVEVLDEFLVEPFKNVGFEIEGRFKEECKLADKYVDEIRMAVFDHVWLKKQEELKNVTDT